MMNEPEVGGMRQEDYSKDWVVTYRFADYRRLVVLQLRRPHMWSRNKINSVLATIYFISAPHVRTTLQSESVRHSAMNCRPIRRENGAVAVCM